MPSSPFVREPDLDALRLHLARLRHERGWSYDELAGRAGIGRATLVALENGRPRQRPGRDPNRASSNGTLLTWYALAEALGIDLGDLLRPIYGDTPSDRA